MAAVLFLLSVIAHSVSAGSLPSLSGLLGAAAVSGALAFAVASQRRNFAWLVLYLVAGQLLVHVAMTAMGHHSVSLLPGSSMTATHLLAAVLAASVFVKAETIAAAWCRAATFLLGGPRLRTIGVIDATRLSLASSVAPCVQRIALLVTPTRGPPAFI